MTRFMREISGELGDYWKHSAEKELAKVQADLDSGAIPLTSMESPGTVLDGF